MKKKKKFDGLVTYLFPGYKVNKWIMRLALLLLLTTGLLGAVLDRYSFREVIFGSAYIECPKGESFCVNPFYEEYALTGRCSIGAFCGAPLLAPGQVIGHRPGFIIQNFGVICFLFLASAVLINHFKYNQGYDFKKKIKRLDL